MQRTWIALGALAGLTAVVVAALAAHRLEPTAQSVVRSGVEMQAWHALALLAVGLWTPQGGRLADAAGLAFALGIGLFCGAVYAVALFNTHLGIMAPVGGTLLMVGWLLLGISALMARRPS